MADAPGCPDRRGNGARYGIAEVAQPGEQQTQHGPFATEQMLHPGNVEHQVTEAGDLAHYRDEWTGIGMPVGEIGKGGLEQRTIDFLYGQIRHHGAGIGQVLPDTQAQSHGFGIDGRQPQPALDGFIEHQRPREPGITPFEIIGRPMRQEQHEEASRAGQAGLHGGAEQGVLRIHFPSNPAGIRSGS